MFLRDNSASNVKWMCAWLGLALLVFYVVPHVAQYVIPCAIKGVVAEPFHVSSLILWVKLGLALLGVAWHDLEWRGLV